MSKIKLKSILKEISDKTTKNNEYRVLTSSQNGIVSQDEYFNKSVASKDNTGYKIIKKGQFTYRSMSDTGYFYINHLLTYDIGIVSPAYPVFEVIDEKVIDPEYLDIYFKSKPFMEEAKKRAKGSTRFSLKFKNICEIEINVPSLSDQKKVIKCVKKYNEAIENRMNTIEELNNYINSYVFNFINSVDGSEIKLKDLVNNDKHSIKRGPFGGSLKKEIFQKDGYLVYEQYHAINDNYTDNNRYFISKEKYDEMINFSVKPHDLIISCSGTFGKISEIPEDNFHEGIINQALLKLSLNNDIVLNKYFLYYFRSDVIQNKLFGMTHGCGIINFPSVDQIKNISFVIPNLKVQSKFVDKIVKIEKCINVVNDELKELHQLLDSQMYDSFVK